MILKLKEIFFPSFCQEVIWLIIFLHASPMLQNIYSTTNVLQCVPFLWFAHVLVFSGLTCNLLTCIYDYNNFQKYITHDFHDRVIPVSNAVLPADLTISVLQYWIAAFTGISVDNLNVWIPNAVWNLEILRLLLLLNCWNVCLRSLSQDYKLIPMFTSFLLKLIILSTTSAQRVNNDHRPKSSGQGSSLTCAPLLHVISLSLFPLSGVPSLCNKC